MALRTHHYIICILNPLLYAWGQIMHVGLHFNTLPVVYIYFLLRIPNLPSPTEEA
jgi:hypothetical protein